MCLTQRKDKATSVKKKKEKEKENNKKETNKT